jgi:hypothetical protein
VGDKGFVGGTALGMSEDIAMLATTTFVLFEHTPLTIWALFMIYILDSVVTWFLW